MKQLRIQPVPSVKRGGQFTNTTLRALAHTLLVFGLLLCSLQSATAQQPTASPTPTKEELEYEKLKLEVKKLNEESTWTTWIPLLLGLLGGAIGASSSLWVARRTRKGAIDQETHQKRLDCYPQLIKATAPLALYFPERGAYGHAALDVDACRAIGREMSRWYFDGGGLLLSVTARDAYFTLARALTRASFATALRVPDFKDDAVDVSREKIDHYSEKLGKELSLALEDVDTWNFEGLAPETKTPDRRAFRAYVFLTKAPGLVLAYPAKLKRKLRRRLRGVKKQTPSAATAEAKTANHERFKDYVFLQRLSSNLRTTLAHDLRSRRRLS